MREGILIEQQAKADLYNIAKDSITNNSLSVLITLILAGTALWFLTKSFLIYLDRKLFPVLKNYLTTQQEFIKSIDDNSQNTRNTLDRVEEETFSGNEKIMNKLTIIEKDVSEVKILLSRKY